MCRNIKTLHNFEPPASPEEVRAAAVQYVRKIAGCARPSRSNAAAFEDAVSEVAAATRRLLDALVASTSPKSREEEARKGRERWQRRAERLPGGGA